MATYEVYYHPVRKFSTIKKGFIWPAFWFGPLWLLYRRCWASGCVILLGSLLVSAFLTLMAVVIFWGGPPQSEAVEHAVRFKAVITFYFFQIVLFAMLAGWGQHIVLRNLKARGFVMVGKYTCKTGDAALALLHKEKKKK